MSGSFIGTTHTIPSADPIIHTEGCMHEEEGRKSADISLTVEKLQKEFEKLSKNVIGITAEQIQAKKEASHQENIRQRRIRKSIKNKALAVAKSKHDRRRIARGATAGDISAQPAGKSKRARTLRREAAANMARLSRKFATKQAVPASETNE